MPRFPLCRLSSLSLFTMLCCPLVCPCTAFAAVFLTTLYFTDIGTFVPCPWANATMITVSEQLECAPPIIPPWLTQTSDVLWMVCVILITKFTPKDSAIVMTTTLDDNL